MELNLWMHFKQSRCKFQVLMIQNILSKDINHSALDISRIELNLPVLVCVCLSNLNQIPVGGL